MSSDPGSRILANIETMGRLMDERPVHRPYAPEAPIPGIHWYGGCSDDYPRVNPDGICEDCGGKACPTCGKGRNPGDPPCDCEKRL